MPPESHPTPAPEDVVVGYSQPRPAVTWRHRALAALVILAGAGSVAGFTKITYDDLPRSWAEDVPAVTLTAEEVAAARAVPSYNGAVPVLAYHFVTSRTDDSLGGEYTTPAAEFARQMEILDEAGFTTITAQQARAFAEDGAALPDKPILLTFDDGHATNRHVVDPILDKHDFNAVGFLITGRVTDDDNPRAFHLNLDDVRHLEASGRWEFGSHTHGEHRRGVAADGSDVTALDHRVLTEDGDLETPQEYADRIDADLEASRAWMEQNLAQPLWQFAYPMGGRGTTGSHAMESQLHAALLEHGFDFAYTVGEHETAHSVVPTTETLAQPRIDVTRGLSATDLLEAVVQSAPVDEGGEQPVGWFDGWFEGWEDDTHGRPLAPATPGS